MVDFHWNAADPWTIVSVSEDGEKTGGGGTLQVTSLFMCFNAKKGPLLLYVEPLA